MSVPSFRQEAASLLPGLVELRRALHREPEVGLVLPLTHARVLSGLDGFDLKISRGRDTTSVVAVLRGGLPWPVVLSGGDM